MTLPLPHRPVRLASLALALAVAGCAAVPVTAPHALPATPAVFHHPAAAATTPATAAPARQAAWWTIFTDPALDGFMERAMAHSTTVQAAAARLTQARALSRHADAQRLPQLGLGASSGRMGGDAARALGEAGTLHQLHLDASYEIDVVGRLSQASRAARLDEQAAASLLDDARLLVQAEVAQQYFALRAADTERALMRATVAAYRQALALTERRYAAGDVAELDVARARTEAASVESQALALDRQRQTLESALAVLVGDLPGASIVPIDPLEAHWSEALPAIPAGLPSTMLARRPDLAAARAGFEAAETRIGVAQAAWFPDLRLTATAGGASAELGQLLKTSAGLWGVNLLLDLPLFDGGRREAGVQAAAAQADEAAARYRAQVLQAFKEVEDQLAGLELLAAQQRSQRAAVDAAQRARALSDTRYREGLVSQLELLDARRTELAQQRLALQIRAAQFQSTVALIKALGGGWSV